MNGVVFDHQRWSIHDGPGARTVVFLKGCPLQCPWCCNPESQNKAPEIAVFPKNCIGCERCVAACPDEVARPSGAGGFSDRSLCRQCGKCVEACVSGAREWMGKEVAAEDVMDIVRRDMAFYRRSGGGVTFSGGEPLSQPDFLECLLKKCRWLGLNTAIETCGYFSWKRCREIIALTDLVYLDIKHMDPERHIELTGVSNGVIIRNAVNIDAQNIPLIIRIPIVPSLNDSVETIREIVDFTRRSLKGVLGVELMPYHTLGKEKFRALGRNYELGHIEAPDDGNMDALREVIALADLDVPPM